jgi:hypothetical protein
VKVTSVTVTPGTLALTPGATGQLAASVAPADAADTRVMWSIAPTSVATISADGLVTAVAPGEATATATTADGGKTATAAVTVTAKAVAVTGVSLNKTTLTLAAGASETLTATVAPGDATNKAVTWKSSKPDIAAVDAAGKVTAVAAGEAVITVTTDDGAKTASCTVTVEAAVVTYTVTFDTDGGSGAPTAQTVAEGEKAVAVTDPTKAFTKREGLYLLPLPASETFAGWYSGDTKWNFATSTVTANVTLKARWTTTGQADLSASAGSNFPAKAVAYANANAAAGKQFLMVLENNYTAVKEIKANLDLTIEGIGGERILTGDIYHFDLLASAKLTLGNGVTLKGRPQMYWSVRVRSGAAFIMQPGSKITGVESSDIAPIQIDANGSFTMEGGEISGNKIELMGPMPLPAGAVKIGASGNFTMTGGKISGNTGGLGDVTVAYNAASFNLKGAAEIGSLTLESNLDATARATVTLTGAFTGKVDALNLYVANTGEQTVVENWVNQVVLKEAAGNSFTSLDVAKFTLGYFRSDDPDNQQGIDPYYRIQVTNSNGNRGKLVAN